MTKPAPAPITNALEARGCAKHRRAGDEGRSRLDRLSAPKLPARGIGLLTGAAGYWDGEA